MTWNLLTSGRWPTEEEEKAYQAKKLAEERTHAIVLWGILGCLVLWMAWGL